MLLTGAILQFDPPFCVETYDPLFIAISVAFANKIILSALGQIKKHLWGHEKSILD
jgi:hypothetical protein